MGGLLSQNRLYMNKIVLEFHKTATNFPIFHMLVYLIKELFNKWASYIMHKEILSNLETCYLAKLNIVE